MRKHLPNLVTLLNLFFGCVAMLAFIAGRWQEGIALVALALLADFLDGFIARLLKTTSPLGKELDSLADVVSFGVVPGVICWIMLQEGMAERPLSADSEAVIRQVPAAVFAFVLTLFAALRLAKFNLDTRQSEHFLGLPTPACTIFVIGLFIIFQKDWCGLKELIANPWFLVPVILALSWLMISEVPMFSLKFKSLRWSGNEIRFIFGGLLIASIFTLREATPAFLILAYMLVSLLLWLLKGKDTTQTRHGLSK